MRITVPALILSVVALCSAAQAQAACKQLSPSPNPAGNTLTNNGANGCNDVTFINSGTINNNGTLTNNATLNGSFFSALNNDGVLNNSAGATMLSGSYGTFSNTGTFNNDGMFGSRDPFSPLNNSAAGTVNNRGTTQGIWQNYGTLNNYASGNLTGNDASLMNYAGGNVNNAGQIRAFNNAGVINNSGTMGQQYGGASNNSGLINNNAGGIVTNIRNAGTFVNNLGAQVQHQVVNSGQFINAGLVTGGISNLGFTQTAGQTVNNGTIAMDVNVTGGVLKGSGNITGTVTVDGGTLAPGNPKGALTIDGNLNFNNGMLLTTIGGTGAGQYSLLNVTGSASFLAGALGFSFINGFIPNFGDHWLFMTAGGGLTGWENLISTSYWGLPSSYGFNVSAADNGLTLTVVAVPEPEIYAMMLAGLGMLGWAGRKAKLKTSVAA